MRKILALLILGWAAAVAHSQVIGINPTPQAMYYWDTGANAFLPCTNSSTAEAYASTPQAFAMYGYNSGLMQWTPQTACLGSGSTGLTSFQGRTTAAAVLLLADVRGVMQGGTSCNVAGGYAYSPYSGTCILVGTNFVAGGDLSGSATSQTVVGIQGKAVVNTAPTDGQALIWNAGLNEYVPATPGFGFAVLLNPSAEQDITGHNLALGGGGFLGLGLTGSSITHIVDSLISNSSTTLTGLNPAEFRIGNSSQTVNTYEGFAAGALNSSAVEVTMGKLAFVNTALTAGAETGVPHLVTRVAGTLTDQGVPCTSSGYGGGDCVAISPGCPAATAGATPNLSFTTQCVSLTLSTNVTSSTATGFAVGKPYTFFLIQPPAGGGTFAPPSTFKGWPGIINISANGATVCTLTAYTDSNIYVTGCNLI